MTLKQKVQNLMEGSITNETYINFLIGINLQKTPFKSRVNIIKSLGYNINALKILCKSCKNDLQVIALIYLHDRINFSHIDDDSKRNQSLEFFTAMQSPEEYFKDYIHIDLELILYVCSRAGLNPKILNKRGVSDVEKMVQECLISPQKILSDWEPEKFPENTFDWKEEYNKFYREKYLSPITEVLENYGVVSLLDFDSFVRKVCVMQKSTIPLDIKNEIEIFQRIFSHKSGLL